MSRFLNISTDNTLGGNSPKDDTVSSQKAVKTALDRKADSSHTHTKSQITDFPSSLPANGGNADTLDGKHASEFAAAADVNTKVSKSGDTMTGDLTINKANPALTLKPTSGTANEYKESSNNDGEFVISSRRIASSGDWKEKLVLRDEYSTIGNCFDVGTNRRNGTRVHALDSWLPGKSANRTFGINPECVIIEVSYDAGTTWQDAGVSDEIKTKMFSITNSGTQLYSFPKKDGAYSTDVQVRLTFSNCNYSVPPNTPETQKYDYWNDRNYVSRNFSGAPIGFYIGLYTSGMTSYADIQMANMYRPDEWIDCKMNIPINNSSIPNCSYAILDTTKYLYADRESTSYAHNIRITFRQSTVSQTSATAIYGIIMCGWINSDINNSMCSEGVPYNVDPLTLKTTFDGAIAKRGGTSSQFLKADGSVDSKSYEDKSNKVTTLDSSSTHYPSCSAVKNVTDSLSSQMSQLIQLAALKENIINKVTSISAQSTDEQYPSAKCVYDIVGNIESALRTIRGI